MTGWRPSVVLKLLENLKKQEALMLNEEQNRKTHDLRVRISMEEERVEAEMERLQMALAGRKMVELAKLSSNGDGDAAAVDMALKGVLAGLERVMKAADCVRLKTLKGILDVLTPMQCVDFLAANIAMQLRLREWGMKDMNVNQDNN
ncbi:protein DOG1-like 4 [Cajanus cajan]|nr:protein DOG1-like 4 [Cajanus cajan]